MLQRILLKPEEEVGLEFFTSCRSDPHHLGSVKMRFGAYIGVPATFIYTSADEVDRDHLRIPQYTIDWTSDVGQALLNAIVLSDKAKEFAIAREINYAATYHLHIDTIMRCGFGILAYVSGSMLNGIFQLSRRLKVWARAGVFSFVAVTSGFLYLLASDAYFCWRDNSIDRKTAQLSQFYAEGGVEFYNKMLERNQALRTVLGARGPSLYTLYGNNVSTWRQPHTQISARRNKLIKHLEAYSKTEPEPKISGGGQETM